MLALTAPVFPLVSSDLAKWERFAQKGGIGSAVATKDQEQLDPSDLMFLQDDHIVVLLDLGHDRYLGYCEEIIGCFSGDSVAFTGKLKRPVLAARSPSLSTSSLVVAQMVPATGIPQYSNGESTRADDAKESLTELSEDIAEDFKSRRRRTNMAGLGIDVATMIARDQPWKNEDARASPSTPDGAEKRAFVQVPPSPSNSCLSRTPSLVTSPSTDFDEASSSGHSAHTPPVPHWSPDRSRNSPSTRLGISPPRSSSEPTETLKKDGCPMSLPLQDIASASYRGRSSSLGKQPYPACHVNNTTSSTSSRSNLSNASSIDDVNQPKLAFSAPSSHRPSFIRLPKTSDSSWRTGSSVGDTPGDPEDQALAMIFDSYRYSTSSVSTLLRARSTTPESSQRASIRKRRSVSLTETMLDQELRSTLCEQPPRSESPLRASSEPGNMQDASPFRFGAASDLRLRLETSGTEDALIRSGVTNSNSRISSDSFVGMIPRLSTIFPRSGTLDSLDSIRTSSQESTRSSRKYPAGATVPEEEEDRDEQSAEADSKHVPLNRRHIGPDSSAMSRSQTTIALVSVSNDAELPDSPTRTRSPGQVRRKSVKGLAISSPLLQPMTAQNSSVWRTAVPLSPICASSQLSPSSAAHSTPRSGIPPTRPARAAYEINESSRTFFDDANAPQQLKGQRPKLTLASPTGEPGLYSLDSPYLPSSPPRQLETASSGSTSPASAFASGQSSPSLHSVSDEMTFKRREREQSAPDSLDSAPPASPALLSPGKSKLRKTTVKSRTPAPLVISSPISLDHSLTSAPLGRGYDIMAPLTSGPISAPLPASPRSLNHKPSRGLLTFGRKTSGRTTASPTSATTSGVKKMVGISSKDFEDETVRLQKIEFEIVKPMRDILRLEEDGVRAGDVSPTPNSIGLAPRPSITLSLDSNGDASSAMEASLTSHGHPTASDQLTPPLSTHAARPVSMLMDEQTIEDHRTRELKWIKSLGSITPAALRKNKKMRAMVQTGIPSSVRGRVWSFLAEADEVRVAGRYKELCSAPRLPIDDIVERDTEKILADHSQMSLDDAARAELCTVLKALVRHDPKLGYAPATAFLGGLLLTQLGDGELVFWTVVSLVERHDLKQAFPSGHEEMRIMTLAFGFLLEQVLPSIAKRFLDLGIDPIVFLPTWLVTCFVPILPWKSVLRATDLILLDSMYKLHVAIAILELSCLDDAELFPTRESIIYFLLRGATQAQGFAPALLMHRVLSVKLRADRIKKAFKRAEAIIRPK